MKKIYLDDKTIKLNILGIKISIRLNKFSAKKQGKLLKIENKFKTLDLLLKTDKSIVRYGDGEFALINGHNLKFQDWDSDLSARLEEILVSNDSRILVGIPDVFASLNHFNRRAAKFWKKYIFRNWVKIYKKLDLDKQYYDSMISRPYMDAKDRTYCQKYFQDFRKLWDKKDIVIVEGVASRLGYNNNLFSNCNSINRILCPARNAYKNYGKIFEFCKTLPKDKLFILALGPMATVLAYDLARLGYRALDLGHIDIEYEWFLKQASKKIPIENKFVNEVENGRVVTQLNDMNYINEIIAQFED